jgi:hypothetical protein
MPLGDFDFFDSLELDQTEKPNLNAPLLIVTDTSEQNVEGKEEEEKALSPIFGESIHSTTSILSSSRILIRD